MGFLVDFEQRLHHWSLDNMFSVVSCVVSVPFYTGFLPILFWVGLVVCCLLLFLPRFPFLPLSERKVHDKFPWIVGNSQSGHSKLARQMTLLMAFCDYVGNSIKVTRY